MNKQPRMIDADKLLELARTGGSVTTYSELVEWVESGRLKPDPIPLPTIKPGDKVKHQLFGLGAGVVISVSSGDANVQFPGVYKWCSLEFLELIPNE